MEVRAVLFDANGTLVDIETDEGRDRVYKGLSHFLVYQGLTLAPDLLRSHYYDTMRVQRQASTEAHPEFDVVAIWRDLLDRHAAHPALPEETRAQLPLTLAQLHRAFARKRLRLYHGVRPLLRQLARERRLAVITDAQSAYAGPELRALGIYDYLSAVIVSGDYGYRKPDARLFAQALAALDVPPEQAIYVGNDMYCDIFGAQQAGLKAVFVPSGWGKKEYANVTPDYVLADITALPQAIAHFEAR